MAKIITLVSCVKTKLSEPAPAGDLFISQLFRLARAYAEAKGDWFVLSARYGVVEPNETIEPYWDSLNSKTRDERVEWAKNACEAVLQRTEPGDTVVLLAATDKYGEDLTAMLEEAGRQVETPLTGLALSQQVALLEEKLEENGIAPPAHRERTPEEKAVRRERRAAHRVAAAARAARNAEAPAKDAKDGKDAKNSKSDKFDDYEDDEDDDDEDSQEG